MSRRLSLATKELGRLEVLLIYCQDGVWEKDWRPLQGNPITGLFTVVTLDNINHALAGWTSPLVKGLGIDPKLALHSLPEKRCALWSSCLFKRPTDCLSNSKKTPWCFEPAGVEGDEAKNLGREVIQMWREGVYVLVIQETT
jgi:hypothetical protein